MYIFFIYLFLGQLIFPKLSISISGQISESVNRDVGWPQNNFMTKASVMTSSQKYSITRNTLPEIKRNHHYKDASTEL